MTFRMKKIVPLLLMLALVPKAALAHCPLCTVGAGALAVLAASLGVSSTIVGVMIGAFALAMSLWIAKLPKKKYIPYQYPVLAVVIFVSTVVPIMPLIRDYSSIYVPFIGEYGATYMYDEFLAGSIVGALIVFVAPYLSTRVTKLRHGSQLPFQGIVLTFLLLIVASLIIQLFV